MPSKSQNEKIQTRSKSASTALGRSTMTTKSLEAEQRPMNGRLREGKLIPHMKMTLQKKDPTSKATDGTKASTRMIKTATSTAKRPLEPVMKRNLRTLRFGGVRPRRGQRRVASMQGLKKMKKMKKMKKIWLPTK